MTEIDEADELMKKGQKEEAHILLQSLIVKDWDDEGLYCDAVAIYLDGKMYPEAKKLFDQFKDRTQQDLRSNFTLEEIEKREQVQQESSGN